MPVDRDHLAERIREAARVVASLEDQLGVIESVIGRLEGVIAGGGVIYTCGNGGSAAEALHLAEELVGRYRAVRPPMPALCLNADPAALTCIANDFGFAQVFARQIEALAKGRDCLVVFSTSGRSGNIVAALEAAQRTGCATVGLLGKDGGAALPLCDCALVVACDDTAHIQEAHQVVLHLLLEALEG